MALASSAELAAWLRANQDKRNTPDYQTVLRGFQEAVIAESRVAATPAQPTAQPESGFMPALRAGATELGGGISALMGKVGLKDIQKAQEEYEAAQKRAKEIFKPTEAGWTEAPVTKFLELLGGSVPYMAAPLAAGAAAATLPVTGPAAAVAGLGAAGLASATQFTATNLGRQMEEGKKLEQTDLGSAALAAVPQAALDTLSMRMIPGIGRLFGKAGIQVTKETAKEIAEQGLKRTLVDYSVNTGKTAGIEGLTEAAQQVFERLQAGLSITDPEARKEYFDNFIGGAVLGGALSVPGRYYERGKAQKEARGLVEEEAQKQQAAQRKAEEEAKKDPAYALKLDADYQAAVARMKELQAAVPKRPGKGALPEEQAAYKAAVEARDAHLKNVLQPLAAEYVPRKAEIAQLKERQRVEGLSPQDYMLEQMGIAIPKATGPATLEEAAAERKEAPAVAPELAYAQEQLEFAQRQGVAQALDADEQRNLNVAFLMQDPAMAKQLVENKTPIPGLDRQESKAVLGLLKLQLKKQEEAAQKAAQKATRAELEQQQTDLAAQQRAVQTDAADLWKASIEETEAQATEELLRPNLELIRPTGPATVKTPENITPIQNANTLLRRIDDLFAVRDQAARDTDTAFGSGNKEAGMKKAQEREAAQTSLNELEQTEGPGRALIALRKAQDTALMNASQLIDDLRAGRTLGGPEAGTASSTPQTLINQINAQRDAFITAAVQEAATTRRLFGKSLTQEEATKAGDQMRGVFNEWVTRTMAQPRREVLEERVVQPAQMRGTEVVRGAETALVDPRPLEERRFGAYREATQVLQEQLRQLASRLAAVPKEGRRVEPTLKMQFPETEAAKVAEARGETAKTLEGALRRRRDYVSNLIDQAFQTRRVPGIADALLTRAQDFLQKPLEIKTVDETTGEETVRYQPRGTAALLDAAENIADRLIRGQNIERSDLVTLRNELRAESARPGEAEVVGEREGQAELFPPETRRALAPAVEGTDLRGQPVAARAGSIGVIRETRRNFENAPPVRQGRAMLKRGQELLENIRAAWDKADKRKARIQEGKVAKAERAVEQQREEYRAAFTDALNKARLEQVVAKFQPQIDAAINQLAAFGKERAKALAAKDKDAARDIQTIMDMEREALQDLRQQLAAAVRAPGAALEPAEMKGPRQTRGFTQPEEVKAAADEWVQFERDALAKAEAKLAKLKGPEKAPAVREVAQQRKAVVQAENVATRAMTGLGLPGVRRVAGEVTPIKAEKESAEERRAEAAERRAEEAEAVKARAEEKTAREAALEQRILDLGERRVEREEALKRVRTDASRERVEKELAEINKQATLAEAQLEALGEKKPRKKGPATVVTGAGLAKQRPLRTGDKTAKREADAYRRMLKSAAAGVRAEREGVVELPGVFEFGPQEKLFSRGSTATPSTIDSVRVELSKAFPDLGRVQIYDSVDALVAANPQYKGKIPSDARGFVDTAGNKAFLIAENINQGQAMSVLLHEVGAHIGLKNALGEAQYNTLVNAVKSWEKRTDNSTEAKVAKAARARVEAAETAAGQVNDELLAYAIEEAVNAGVKPTETKGVLGQWLSRVAALLRKALEKFGLPPKALDAQGIVDMAFGAAKMEMRREAAAPETAAPEAGEILFSRNLPTASRVAENLVAEQPGVVQKIKDNLLGLGARTQFIDKLAPTEEALKRGKVEDLKATQALYYLRMYDQRMHFTSQAITDGVPERKEITRADGRKEYLIEAKSGANLQQVVDILKKKDVVKAAGSADAANKLFTLYLAALRAKRVGIDALNFGGKVTQADLDSALAEIESNPTLKDAFSEARDIYNQYNRNLIEFAVQTGAIGKDVANRLLVSNDYIPYYRMREGVAQLIVGKETPVRIGNLKDSPHLQELIGGDEAIFDFLTSSVQNTSMLLDMSMRNLATKNLMFELRDAGLAKISKATKTAPAGAVTFKKDGEEYFAIVDTDALGVDSELLVKGLAGIPTMFPTFVRLFGIPARLLRRVVVASPVYMARQLVRDSTSAAIASGANIVPVLSSLKQIGKPSALERRGITGGQVFTGMPEDQTRILKDMQAGKLSLSSGLAWLEAKSAQVDALTREAQYQSYREQGLSEMEATFMALESMNFSRRGLSPTVHMISTLIPFMNAQIQGLDVLYRAFTGKMSMNERLEVRKKLWTRGLMLAGLSTLYALSMDDEDEAYKNAKPEEKYGNWFVPIPGMEQPLRVPIPFELGYIFKALPEAMVNILRSDTGAEEAWKAFKHIGVQTVPGLSSYFMPQAVKPALEVLLDRSFYTDRALESAREQMVEPGFRYRDNTTELAKWVGEATGFSPIKMEYLIRGYTGGMGLAFLQALSAPLGRTGPEGAAKRPSDLPVIGTLFQPTDASGIIDATYEKMNKVRQIQETYEDLIDKGRVQDANAYLKENADELALASVAGSFRQQMGDITKYERAVRNSTMTPDQKRKALDEARQAKITLAAAVRGMVDKRAPQAALA